MSIGAGLILIPIAILCLILGLIFFAKKRIVGGGLFFAGVCAVILSVLMLTGVYDPYAHHIR